MTDVVLLVVTVKDGDRKEEGPPVTLLYFRKLNHSLD